MSAHASLQYTYNSGEKQCAKLGLLLWLHIQHKIVFQMVGKLLNPPIPSSKVWFKSEWGIGRKPKHGGKGYLNTYGA